MHRTPEQEIAFRERQHSEAIAAQLALPEAQRNATLRKSRVASQCRYRSTFKTIDRDVLDCGCGGVVLHRCDHFGELVTRKRPKPDTLDLLTRLEPDFHGRRCDECKVWDDCPPYRSVRLADEQTPPHFVTTLTDDFAPGLRALLISMADQSQLESYRFTVVALDHIRADHVAMISDVADVEWIDRSELAATPSMRTTRQRLAPNFNKLLMWHLPFDHPCIFVDSDCLCVGSLDEVRYWRPQTVVRNFARRESERRSEANYKTSTLPIWNSGFFCFQPDRAVGESIVDFAERNYTAVQLGDQEVLNDWFATHRPSDVRYADHGWNYRTYLGVDADIRILHYAHPEKPWRDRPRRRHQRESFALWKSVASGERGYDRFRREFRATRKG